MTSLLTRATISSADEGLVGVCAWTLGGICAASNASAAQIETNTRLRFFIVCDRATLQGLMIGAPDILSDVSLHMPSRSGVGATVHGEVRASDVGRIGTGHEGYQRGDFVNCSEAGERCISLLRHGPIACSRIQIRINRTGLDIVDRDAAASHLSRQSLREHFDGTLRG